MIAGSLATPRAIAYLVLRRSTRLDRAHISAAPRLRPGHFCSLSCWGSLTDERAQILMADHPQRLTLGLCAGERVLDRSAALLGLDAIVFPELLDGGYAALERGRGSHQEGDDFWQHMVDASRRLTTTIVAGSVRLIDGRGRATNTSLVFSRGRLRYRYDKIHLFGPTGDRRYFSRGHRAGVFTLARARGPRRRSAVILCYDLRFPELVRSLALAGTEILFVPARWPAVRDLAWRTLLCARAIENQLFVVGCNAPDEEGGRSYVFGPGGEELFGGRVPRTRPVRIVLEFALRERARRLHRPLQEAVVLQETVFPRWVRGGLRRTDR